MFLFINVSDLAQIFSWNVYGTQRNNFFVYYGESKKNCQVDAPSTSDTSETFRVCKAHSTDNYSIRTRVTRTYCFRNTIAAVLVDIVVFCRKWVGYFSKIGHISVMVTHGGWGWVYDNCEYLFFHHPPSHIHPHLYPPILTPTHLVVDFVVFKRFHWPVFNYKQNRQIK